MARAATARRTSVDVTALQATAASLGCSMASVLHAAWAIVLASCAGVDDVLAAPPAVFLRRWGSRRHVFSSGVALALPPDFFDACAGDVPCALDEGARGAP